ncbi:hypothetical protein BD779DRAFT_1088908 [Infundibulicybe gibba]|nr:hypothetical protein BD779DRAFT_1088908 [Infundibulicybe gibba]
MAPHVPDLRDRSCFPSFGELPEYGYAPSFYKQDGKGGYCPKKHWCFLVEIKQRSGWPLRPTYDAKDINGEIIQIAFYLDNESLYPEIEKKCQPGYTIAFMYAKSHFFMSGQEGIRVEETKTMKVFPRNLQSLLEISDRVKVKSTDCSVCQKKTRLRCSFCCAKYCDKQCQTTDWKRPGGHKTECPVRRQINSWGSFNWGRFERFQDFDTM